MILFLCTQRFGHRQKNDRNCYQQEHQTDGTLQERQEAAIRAHHAATVIDLRKRSKNKAQYKRCRWNLKFLESKSDRTEQQAGNYLTHVVFERICTNGAKHEDTGQQNVLRNRQQFLQIHAVQRTP